MEVVPPNDIELRNIIDKLAEFVARNGPEFESMTKTKQKGNAKFAFLYGGEYYNYYQYKVATKQQALMKQQGGGMNPFNQQQNQQSQNSNQMPQIWSNPPPGPQVAPQQPPPQPAINAQIAAQIEAITTQQNALREQIRQSDINLQAQHGVLLQQQQVQIDEAVTRAQNDALVKQSDEHKISLSDFDAILQPIIDSCTKDSISNGKGWILQHCTDSGKCQIISQYLLRKALIAGVLFAQKLHLIYLVNDVIHHCNASSSIRKRNDELKKCLEGAVIPMFCNAQITTATDEQRAKLTKLLSLWESKGNFFDACVISKLKSPPSSLQEYQNSLLTQYAAIVAQITQATKSTFDNYQQQHQAFVQHATQQLALLEKQKQQIEQQAIKAAIAAQQQQQQQQTPVPLLPELSGAGVGGANSNNGNPLLGGGRGGSDRDGSIPSLLDQNINYNMISGAIQNLQQQQGRDRDNGGGGSDNRSGSYSHSNDSGDGNNNGDYSHPPPNFPIPDMSRPPPYMHQQQQQSQFPAYDDDIVDRRNEFDDPPMDDDERCHHNEDEGGEDDEDGHLRHLHPDDDQQPDFAEEKPRSPSPQPVQPSIPYFELPAGLMVPLIRLEDFNYHPLEPEEIRLPPPAPPNERLLSAVEAFYAPPSHERPRDGEGWEKLALYEYFKVKNASRKQKEEELESGTRERSRSPTPIDPDWLKATKKPKKRVYRSRSRSKSREPSPRARSPPMMRRRSRSRSRSPRRGRNRSPRSPIRRDRRSLTPPSFGGGGFGSKSSGNPLLMEDKVPQHQQQQHQQQLPMMKMGGGGGGGGMGMSAGPVGGEVWGGHDREGLGSYGARNSDPYESFRKNKGAAFITRMKTQTDR
ncbi:calcium homeostasis endoplasmic reticulum protein isoform X2 [Culex pipiens pallens]|uniref:calcium homeostasis endoplasmic reticulum protein isoform X2 n=1 Tax=Culex pipiens pallens TaxID=42434 RepID=UPI0019544F7E|nr:calcium homeostasis endoplasmic reticulum protein isoform X2 [Culex pipiens pallens]